MRDPLPDGPWVVAPWHSGTVMPQRWIDGDRDGTAPEDRGPFATIHTTSPELALRVVDALNAAGVAAGPQTTPEDDEALRRAAVAESIYQRHADGWHAVMHEIIEPPCWNRSNPDDTEPLTADEVAWMRGEPLPVVAAPTGQEDQT